MVNRVNNWLKGRQRAIDFIDNEVLIELEIDNDYLEKF